MKTQVVVIHGGTAFDTYDQYLAYLQDKQIAEEDLLPRGKDWKGNLQEALGEDYQVITPRMPNSQNAKYLEWKIWFDKYVPLLRDGVILVGHSLGGIFLAKYLAEHDFPKEIRAVMLVAAPTEGDAIETLADFKLPVSVEKFASLNTEIFLYHSTDDPIVPFVQLGEYRNMLPSAHAVVLHNRAHIWQEEFPELVRDIQTVSR